MAEQSQFLLVEDHPQDNLDHVICLLYLFEELLCEAKLESLDLSEEAWRGLLYLAQHCAMYLQATKHNIGTNWNIAKK